MKKYTLTVTDGKGGEREIKVRLDDETSRLLEEAGDPERGIQVAEHRAQGNAASCFVGQVNGARHGYSRSANGRIRRRGAQ